MTRRAIRFLDQVNDEPFFLMVSHFFVHDPNHTRVRWLYERYYEALPESPRREKLAHYGAMVTTLDHHVGALQTALSDTGKADSTLVVFTSDNGGHPNYAGNAPLRGSKWNLYEGGIRVPFIVRWPGVAKSHSICDVPVWSPDLFPTFAELTGADSSTAKDGRSLAPLLRNQDKQPAERNMVWHFPYYHPETRYAERIDRIGIDDGETSKTKPHSAILAGNWKLLHFYENDADELYDLSRDPSEAKNLASVRPDHAETLRNQLLTYLKDANARFPTVNK